MWNFPQSCLLSCSKKKKTEGNRIGDTAKKKKKPCFYPGSGQTNAHVSTYTRLGNVTPSVVTKKERGDRVLFCGSILSSFVHFSFIVFLEKLLRTKYALIMWKVIFLARITFEDIRFETWNRLKFKSLTSFQRNPDISLSLSLSIGIETRDWFHYLPQLLNQSSPLPSFRLSRLLAASFCFDRLVVFNEKSPTIEPSIAKAWQRTTR